MCKIQCSSRISHRNLQNTKPGTLRIAQVTLQEYCMIFRDRVQYSQMSQGAILTQELFNINYFLEWIKSSASKPSVAPMW